MVSPSAEKFLGAPASHFLGRRVNEIFPTGHPLHQVLQIEGDELSEIAAETARYRASPRGEFAFAFPGHRAES